VKKRTKSKANPFKFSEPGAIVTGDGVKSKPRDRRPTNPGGYIGESAPFGTWRGQGKPPKPPKAKPENAATCKNGLQVRQDLAPGVDVLGGSFWWHCVPKETSKAWARRTGLFAPSKCQRVFVVPVATVEKVSRRLAPVIAEIRASARRGDDVLVALSSEDCKAIVALGLD